MYSTDTEVKSVKIKSKNMWLQYKAMFILTN